MIEFGFGSALTLLKYLKHANLNIIIQVSYRVKLNKLIY